MHPESEAEGEITVHIATTADELKAVALGLIGGQGGSAAVVEVPDGDPVAVGALPDGLAVGGSDSFPAVSFPAPPPSVVELDGSGGTPEPPASVLVGRPDPLAPGLLPPLAVPGVVTQACGLNMDCDEPAMATIR
ncbi:MAG: hypothetical protein ACKN9D_06185 [Actinomycetales bacterium]